MDGLRRIGKPSSAQGAQNGSLTDTNTHYANSDRLYISVIISVILIETNTDGATCTWVGRMSSKLPVAMAERAHEAERSELSSLAAEQLGRTLPGRPT